jgi:SulP family sulfate permease
MLPLVYPALMQSLPVWLVGHPRAHAVADVQAGLLRLGFLAQLRSRPVVSGFIAGSAILILIRQLKFLVGVPVHAPSGLDELRAVGQQLNAFNPYALGLALATLATLTAARFWGAAALRRLDLAARTADTALRLLPLLVLGAATALVAFAGWDRQHGVAVVGTLSGALPWWQPTVPGWAQVQALAMPALSLAFITTVQGISMAQAHAMAARRRERLDTNRELVGLGAANLVAAVGMVDVRSLKQAWAYDRADAAAWLGAAAGVLLLGLQWGIALGIVLSLATLLLRASTPHIAVLGHIAGTEHFRNIERHGELQTLPGVLLLRVD